VGFHINTIIALQFVFPCPSPTPYSATAAPVNTGVVNPSPSEANVVGSASGADSGAGGAHGSLSVSLASGLSPLTLRSIVKGSRAIGLGEDPPAVVPGITPMHSRTRLLSMASDGKLAVHDVFTGACLRVGDLLPTIPSHPLSSQAPSPPSPTFVSMLLCSAHWSGSLLGVRWVDSGAGRVIYEDACPVTLGNLRAAQFTKDGCRVGLATTSMGMWISPVAGLHQATPCPVLVR
jgi:hypothetical protein